MSNRYLYDSISPHLPPPGAETTGSVPDAALRPGRGLPAEAVARVVARVILHRGPGARAPVSVGQLDDTGGYDSLHDSLVTAYLDDSRGSVPEPGAADGVAEAPLGPGRQPAVPGALQLAGLRQVSVAPAELGVDEAAPGVRALHPPVSESRSALGPRPHTARTPGPGPCHYTG